MPEGQMPDAPATDPVQETGGGTTPTAEPTTFDVDYVRKLRSEAADNRKKAQALEAENNAFKAERLTETEKLQKQLADLSTERDTANAELLRYRAESAATTAGAIYPDLVAAKLPADVLGDRKDTDAAIERLRKQYPSLFRAPHGNGDGAAGGRPASSAGDMNAMMRRAAGIT